jgi:diguanylate cyclase (GGDEF)-like protein/PAS domain S-box-containing protein
LKVPDSFSVQRLKDLLKLLGVAALYFLLAKMTLSYLAGSAIVSIIWPASGFALAMLLIGGKRYAVSVLLGSFIFNATNPHNTLLMAAGFAAGSTLEALAGESLLTRSGKFNADFTRMSDFMRLIVLAGFIAAIIGALIGATILLASNLIAADAYIFPTLAQWWMGDVLGIIMLTPLILVWKHPPDGWLQPRRLLEILLVLGLAFVSGQIIFIGWLHDIFGTHAKGFFMFLFIVLAAVRLGTHGTLAVLFMVALQGIVGVVHGVGYFAGDIASTQLLDYWLYLMTLSIVGITLSTYISANEEDREALREQEEFFHMITENIDDLIAVLDLQGRRLYNSPSYAKLFGDARTLQNTDSFSEIHPEDRDRVKQVFRDTVETGTGHRIEFRFVLSDGSVRDMESRGGLIRDSSGNPMHVVVVTHDITERKRIEQKVHNMAFYDALTQLPNRPMLHDRLGLAMAASKRSGIYGALLFLDLDNFKPLNDLHGHNVGDLLLVEVAHRIKRCLRAVDTVARFGGDEFVIMLSDLDEDKAESSRQAETVAEKIRDTIAASYLIKIRPNGTEITIEHHCTASIGVALFLGQDDSQEEIIRRADQAMYRAKDDGRNLIRFHS